MQNQRAIDDKGTTPKEAVNIIRTLRDRAFNSNDEKLAIALGRPVDEIQSWIDGETPIDEDALLKARAIALERGVDI
jgi:hypothetical protein